PPVVARSNGAHFPAPRRAHGPHLARLVRDLERRRRLATPDARPEPAVPRARPRLVPGAAARRDEGPGDVAVVERERQLALVAERELRARDDGALHPRRGARLRRVRRPRAGTRTDRLPQRLEGRRLCKSPAVYPAGLLRRLGRGIDTTSWSWLGAMAGQQLFYPPNVAGWDDSRWLDTATWRGRWWIAGNVLHPYSLDPGTASQPYDAAALVDGALTFWNAPVLTDGTHAALSAFAQAALADAGKASWKRKQYPVMTQ